MCGGISKWLVDIKSRCVREMRTACTSRQVRSDDDKSS